MSNGNNIVQTGSVTPGHAVMWTTDGAVQDAGAATSGNLTQIGVTNNGGIGIGVNSGSTASPFEQFGISVASDGVVSLIAQSYGGGPSSVLRFVVDGVVYPLNTVLPTGTEYVVNIKQVGAIGDGSSHPLSGVTSFLGYDTAGWSLAQWQALFPFATSLTNELDQCVWTQAVLTASAEGWAVYAPGGRYQGNFTPAITLGSSGSLSFYGDGPGSSRFEMTGNSGFLTVTYPAVYGAQSFATFTAISVYQAGTTITGTGLSITGTSAGTGRPTITCNDCLFGVWSNGQALNAAGAFATAVTLTCIDTCFFNSCQFCGAYNSTGSGANDRQGVGIQVNGNSTFFSFGPDVLNSYFVDLDTAILVGTGTSSYVQGPVMSNCNFVACNLGVHWVGQTSGGNDGLQISNCEFQCYTAGIRTDTILTHAITGSYFLGSASNIGIDILESGTNSLALAISSNIFVGYGAAGAIGIRIAAAASQRAVSISANQFFDYNAAPGGTADAWPVSLLIGTVGVAVTGNSFSDCNSPIDAGSNNLWGYNTGYSTSTTGASYFAQGIPVLPPTFDQAFIIASGFATFGTMSYVSNSNRIIYFYNASNVLQADIVSDTSGDFQFNHYTSGTFDGSLTINGSGVQLGSSAGPTLITNALVIGSTATSSPSYGGLFQFTHMTAAPTSTPTAGSAAFDTSTNALYIYNGTAWKSVTLS